MSSRNVSSRERLGWNDFFERQLTAVSDTLAARGCQTPAYARVVEQQRGLLRIDGDVTGWADVSGRFRHEATSPAAFPAVGDWVAATADAGSERAIVHQVLERRSVVTRRAAGTTDLEQVLVANVDSIFIVSAFGHDLNLNRIERYLTLVWDAGATPVVVLNKADLVDDPRAVAEEIRGRLGLVDVVVVHATEPRGLDALAAFLTRGATVALLGSSGVGKSTIVNRLLGDEAQRVGAIRESDGKGRHTTTARQLIEVPGGALLIDTPGMRELQLWTESSAVSETFDDIARLAGSCRFSDCAHESEPGCAVREAVATGTLDADRLEHYRRLLREVAYEERKRDPTAAAEHRRLWKALHRQQRALYRERNRN